MAKTIKTQVKLQIPAGKANPAPPVGPALGQAGVNIQEFCTKFNNETKDKMGSIIPVVITVYDDRTFTFITKTPPASDLLRKAAGVSKGAGDPLREKVGSITRNQLREIAEIKMPDLETEGKLLAIPGTPPNLLHPPVGDAFALRSEYAMQIDFEEAPPLFKISETHYAATWLLHEYAPKVTPPAIIVKRKERFSEVSE